MAKLVKINENKISDKTKSSNPNNPFSRFNDEKINRYEHLCHIDYLMREEKEALRLHIDNLVLTYGMKAVREVLEKTSLNTVKKAKKVG